jgi:hypothetical protein
METTNRSVGSVELCTQKQQFRIWNWLRINLSLSFDAQEKKVFNFPILGYCSSQQMGLLL